MSFIGCSSRKFGETIVRCREEAKSFQCCWTQSLAHGRVGGLVVIVIVVVSFDVVVDGRLSWKSSRGDN